MPKKDTKPATIYATPIVWAAGLHHIQSGTTFMFRDFQRTRIRIGRRREGIEISLRDPRVSDIHALVERRANGQLVLHDVGSTNGILINGGPLYGPAYLESRTVLMLGRTELRGVNERGLIPIVSHSIGEFCFRAVEAYGGYRPAATKLEAAMGDPFSYDFIRDHASKWKREELSRRCVEAGKSARIFIRYEDDMTAVATSSSSGG